MGKINNSSLDIWHEESNAVLNCRDLNNRARICSKIYKTLGVNL